MQVYGPDFWKKTPFLKLLLALASGIIFQWYFKPPLTFLLIMLPLATLLLAVFFYFPLGKKYRYGLLNGVLVFIIFFCTGAVLVWQKDIRNDKKWFGNHYENNTSIIVTLDEPPVEKTKSYKAEATVEYVLNDSAVVPVKGKIIIYFKKDSSLRLCYGSQLLFKKPLQEIKNAGNPGGFDYKRYSLFQGITHQVYLKPGEFELLTSKKEKWFRKFIYSTRDNVLTILRKYIRHEKELGLAEALLIGYKNDLEQSLVQSYTNTGVVHIIAISGLHLGLIYWLLGILLRPLQKSKRLKWVRPLLIITGLWLFSLLAGAQPSILRSALMFTFIVLGDTFLRKTSVYNTMAVSAFVLLCINPFYLWDVGFQLSYAAVLSIIIFMRPVYNWFYIPNKMLDFIWKLNAVTIAAQVLTVPVGIYHFHQFPNLFLLTNFVAVPLSSIILLGEILLCCMAVIPPLATVTGKLLSFLIHIMNSYIEKIETIRFSLWDGLQISMAQALLLFVLSASVSYWLMEKQKKGLIAGLGALLLFICLRTWSFTESEMQQKIIVYNVPQKRAVDFINGRNYFFAGDNELLEDGFARNFHLKPSRILFRINDSQQPANLTIYENYARFLNKNILLIDQTIDFEPAANKLVVDLVVISKNPKLYIRNLSKTLDIKQVVFDGSVPFWKTVYWKRDCDSLNIPWHDVSTQGAFVMRLN